jgi:hypothetical protein
MKLVLQGMSLSRTMHFNNRIQVLLVGATGEFSVFASNVEHLPREADLLSDANEVEFSQDATKVAPT